jgi:toxin ParE1/3/4
VQVVWTRGALSDLTRIVAYIEAANPWAASRLAAQLLSAANSLERLPRRGRPGLVPGTRELAIIRPYVIAYRAAESVEILRVWHAAQDR